MPFTHTFTGSNPVRVTIWNQPADRMICRFSLSGYRLWRIGRTGNRPEALFPVLSVDPECPMLSIASAGSSGKLIGLDCEVHWMMDGLIRRIGWSWWFNRSKIIRLDFLFLDLPERGKFKSESDIIRWPDKFCFSISMIRNPVSIGSMSVDSGWLWCWIRKISKENRI